MRLTLTAVLATLAVLLSLDVVAGETLLGKLQTYADGGLEVSNGTTITPFYVPPAAKVTMYCDSESYVITDTNAKTTVATGTNPGLRVAAYEKFPTSVGTQVRLTSQLLPDGGWTPNYGVALGGAIIRVLADAGTTCPVYERRGTE